MKDLPDKLKHQIKSIQSPTSFKFGDGHKVLSHKKVSLPANTAGVNCFIEIEIMKQKHFGSVKANMKKLHQLLIWWTIRSH